MAGVIAFAMADMTESTVFALFTHPDHEGRGAGKALMSRLVSELKARGHRIISLSTDPNTRAHRFYLTQGWIETGRLDNGEISLELHC